MPTLTQQQVTDALAILKAVALTPPTPIPLPPGTSPDGTTVPPAVSITDANGGIWTLGTVTTPYGVQILLNGSNTQAHAGSGTQIEWKGGRTYVMNNLGNWYVWAYNSSSPWTQTNAP